MVIFFAKLYDVTVESFENESEKDTKCSNFSLFH